MLYQHVGAVARREKSTGPDVELIGVVKLNGCIQTWTVLSPAGGLPLYSVFNNTGSDACTYVHRRGNIGECRCCAKAKSRPREGYLEPRTAGRAMG